METKTQSRSYRLPETALALIERAAAQRMMSPSEWVRRTLVINASMQLGELLSGAAPDEVDRALKAAGLIRAPKHTMTPNPDAIPFDQLNVSDEDKARALAWVKEQSSS